MKNKPETQKGITLTMLVVTIVVILILATITIDLTFDENGIIKRAKGLQGTINETIENEEDEMDKLANHIEQTLTNAGMGIIPTVNDIGEGGSGEESEVPQKPKVKVNGTQGEEGYYRSDVEIVVTSNDRAHTLTYTVEGTGIDHGSVSTETSIGNGQSIHITQDGTFTVTVYEYNRDGKKSDGTQMTITRDATAPTASLTVTRTEEDSITVQLVAIDPEPSSGLASSNPYTMYYKEEGTETWIEDGKGATSTYTYTGLKLNTSYSLKAEATDRAGNTGISNELTNVQVGIIDDTKPGITPIAPREPEIIKSGETSTEILLTSTEQPVTIKPDKFIPIDEDGNPITDPTTKVTVTQDDDGNIHITITGGSTEGTVDVEIQPGGITDPSGNENDKIIIDTNITIDNTAPTITNITTSNPTDKGFTVTIEAQDNQGGSGLAEENTYNIYVKTSKATGYQAPVTTANNTYTFDNLAPTIEDASAVQAQTNAPYLHQGMNPVIWVDKNEDGTIEEATEEITKYTDLTAGTINQEWTQNDGDSIWAVYNQYGVTYDIYATATDNVGNVSEPSQTIQQTMELNTSIDHKESHWANVKIEEDGSYFVWIPRYAYEITPTTDSTPSETNAGTIDVKFINGTGTTAFDGTTCAIATSNIDSTSQYVVHPAFCTDVNMGGYAQELEGIWVAKYESSREDSTDGTTWTESNTSSDDIGNVLTTNAGNISDTKIRLVSKPGVTSWRNITIGNSYTNAYNYNRGMDSHLMKNSEWGATAYLTHSQYGRNGNEITINNSSDYITGNAGDSISADSAPGVTNAYNTIPGMQASTTGNITGVYDMSGGTSEYIAAFNNSGESGMYFFGDSFASPGGSSTKYATAYEEIGGIDEPNSSDCILGDATYEVYIKWYIAWFYDYTIEIIDGEPFASRSGDCGLSRTTGVFYTERMDGQDGPNTSFRICLPGGKIEDTTAPVITVSPASGAVAKTRNVMVSIADLGYSEGLAEDNSYTWYLSTSDTNPTASGYVSGTYTPGEVFTIGTGLTGTYYLFLPTVADKAGNTSTETIAGYYRCGTYIFDNTAPTVSNVVLDTATAQGFNVTITATDTGEAGIESYMVYYKTSNATTYSNVTTTNATYTFTNLEAGTIYNVYVEAIDTVNNISQASSIKTITTSNNTIPTSQSYVGYYADIDGNGSVDGIIYADLAVGGSGVWNDDDWSGYAYSAVTEGLKEYYVSKTGYEGIFGTKDVLAPQGSGEDRFYVMALEDITPGTRYCWYDAATGKLDNIIGTSENDFGQGKANTADVLAKWKAEEWGVQNDNGTYQDMWGEIEDEIKAGWFVPSKSEWSAFGDVTTDLGVTTSNYKTYGLSDWYWSSSQYITSSACQADFYGGFIGGNTVINGYYVRLSATF